MYPRDDETLIVAPPPPPQAPRGTLSALTWRTQPLRLSPGLAASSRDDGSGVLDGIDEKDFCGLLLAALAQMAAKSKRRQADLDAVLSRSRLRASPDRVRASLLYLEQTACIRELVPLYDGGLLLTVTNLGMDTLGRAADWRFLQQFGSSAH